MDEQNQLQEVNITSLWNKNLFESLQRLQDFERICRDGAVSITEYLQVSPQRIPELQFQYLKMMVSELGILLGNARARISKTFFLRAKIQLKQMKQTIDLNPQSIFIPSVNQQTHQTNYHLSEEFYTFLSLITQLREGIVTELGDILYGKAEEKVEGMDKSKPLR
ncbi:MAG: hypothetical protein KAJ49_03380 [Arcobacteraceae bacterium]|nr:hypothetical protein [Arcobacteraceae bacterium]